MASWQERESSTRRFSAQRWVGGVLALAGMLMILVVALQGVALIQVVREQAEARQQLLERTLRSYAQAWEGLVYQAAVGSGVSTTTLPILLTQGEGTAPHGSQDTRSNEERYGEQFLSKRASAASPFSATFLYEHLVDILGKEGAVAIVDGATGDVIAGETLEGQGVEHLPIFNGALLIRWKPTVTPAAVMQWTHTLQGEVALLVLVVGALMVIVLFLVRMLFIRPLLRLARVAQAIAGGDFTISIPSTRVLELAPLEHAFQRMLTHIRETNERLITRLQRTIAQQEQAAKMLLRRELELREANERLRHLDQQKSEFLSIAAHQLRTPLSAVRWALSLLLGGDYGALTPQQRVILQKAYESNKQMISLVNDLLDVDRIEGGRLRVEPREVDLCTLLREVALQHLPGAVERNLRLSLKINTAPCPRAWVDPALLRHVLQNVIENACKYTPRGGSVTISLNQEGEEAVIEVHDTGIGIPREAQERLFTKFFRASNAMTQATEGSGLGLYLAHRLLDRMGGRITLESEEGKGTTVRITIPMTPVRPSTS